MGNICAIFKHFSCFKKQEKQQISSASNNQADANKTTNQNGDQKYIISTHDNQKSFNFRNVK